MSQSLKQKSKLFAVGLGLCTLALTMLPSPAAAHGSGSSTDGACRIEVGHHNVELSAYQPGSFGKKLCADIPYTGSTTFIIDIEDPELRREEISVWLIKTDTGSWMSAQAAELNQDNAVMEIPAQTYQRGNIRFDHVFADAGDYALVMSVNGHEAALATYPLHVNQTLANTFSSATWMLMLSGLLGVGLLTALFRTAVAAMDQQ